MINPSRTTALADPASAPDGGALETPGPDTRLRLARRLDWRFLLPHSALGAVALLGDPDEELSDSLALFAVTVIRPGHGEAGSGPTPTPADVAVIRRGGAHDLDLAARWLRPGGALYVEIERGRPPVAGLSHPGARARRELGRRGFDDVTFHWHRPDFLACLEMIPLDAPGVLKNVMVSRSRRWQSRARGLLGGALARLGLLARAVPCWSVVARKTADVRR